MLRLAEKCDTKEWYISLAEQNCGIWPPWEDIFLAEQDWVLAERNCWPPLKNPPRTLMPGPQGSSVPVSCKHLEYSNPHFNICTYYADAVHAVMTPRISFSPYISHLQNINFCLVYVIIIINRNETRNLYPVDWSSHFPLYILFFLSRQGSGLTLFGTLSQSLPSHTY